MSLLRMLALGTASTAIAMISPTTALAQDRSSEAVAAVQARMELIDQQKNRIPGRVLVFAKAGENAIIDTRGTINVETGEPLTEQTPVYIASMTKAFVGLMAVRLDQMGIMPLDMSLADAYPDMSIEGVDLTSVSMRHALSHRLGFYSNVMSLRTAYTDQLPVSEYEKVVSAAHELTETEFNYSNTGYILYAGALERHTGRSWKAWLDELVLHPLGMRHSSSRASDLAGISNTHEIYGEEWKVYSPKSDSIMHAAGGLFVSGEDMGKWLAANAGAASKIGANEFAAAQQSVSEIDRDFGPIKCTGYAMGWSECELGGITFLEHGGTYTGSRSEMIVVPELGVGFAAIFNSDSVTGRLGARLMMTYVAELANMGDTLPSPEQFAEDYARRADRYRMGRSRQDAKPHIDFESDARLLATYTGRYVNPVGGELRLAVEKGQLVGWLNGMEVLLKQIDDHVFSAQIRTSSNVEEISFGLDAAGSIKSVDWDGLQFLPL